MTDITSNTNSQFKTFLSLTESKGLKKEGQFLLSGKALVAEFLENPHLQNNIQIMAEILMEGMTTLTSKASGAKVYKLSKALFEEIDVRPSVERIAGALDHVAAINQRINRGA